MEKLKRKETFHKIKKKKKNNNKAAFYWLWRDPKTMYKI